MTNLITNPSPRRIARIAGSLYLAFIVTFAFSSFAYSKFIVPEDASATAANILASEWFFRMACISELLSAVLFLLAAWALYTLLKPVNKDFAMLFMLLNLAGVTVECISVLNQFAALLLLSAPHYLKIFQVGQLQAASMLFLKLHTYGFMIAQIVYGAWLFPLGYLVLKSGFLPRLLGVLLILDCSCWLAYFFQFFLFPGYKAITYLSFPLAFIVEFSFSLWLAFKGTKNTEDRTEINRL